MKFEITEGLTESDANFTIDHSGEHFVLSGGTDCQKTTYFRTREQLRDELADFAAVIVQWLKEAK